MISNSQAWEMTWQYNVPAMHALNEAYVRGHEEDDNVGLGFLFYSAVTLSLILSLTRSFDHCLQLSCSIPHHVCCINDSYKVVF